MCGIIVSVALKRQGPSQVNGHVRPYTNGDANATSYGHVNGDLPNGTAKGHHPPPELSGRKTLEEQLNKSLDLIAHRGPDAKGIWIDESGNVALAHNRLSINDLSPAGTQPLHSPSGVIHAVVNGEIYDADRLRAELAAGPSGYRFRGHSDSELVVALYERHGAPEFLAHLRGEFALVVYDERDGRVVAARDRFGIKPLFWTVVGGEEGGERRVLMAAEAKAFLPLGWQPEWNVSAIFDSGWHQHDPRTVFKGVKKLLPGYWMEISTDGEIRHHEYWDIDYKDKREIETQTMEEMILGVRERLMEAIRLRLRADVPIGIYLSGGIDSSTLAGMVTHLVREEGVRMGSQDPTKRICCFCIKFPSESGYDESEIAERTAAWLGVKMLKKDLNEAELARHFADSVWHCEHHNFDLNSVGKFALSTLPREHGFKVILTGEGSDEHFAGYPFFAPDFLREPDLSLPDSPLARDGELREGMLKAVQTDIEALSRRVGLFAHGWDEPEARRAVNNIFAPSAVLAASPYAELFHPWVRDRWVGLDCRDTLTNSLSPRARDAIANKWHPMHAAEYVWSKSQLANNLLSCLGDRTEMAHSMEARPPFLDHVLSEYVNSLPPSVKVAYKAPDFAEQRAKDDKEAGPWWEGVGVAREQLIEKMLLREAGRPFITKELYGRRKHPYVAPLKWPRGGPIHTMLEGLCTREKVERLGFVDYGTVRDALERGFGPEADGTSYRHLLFVGAWVTMSERFGIKTARKEDWI